MSNAVDSIQMTRVREQLAPEGLLRVAVNMSNFLLVNTQDKDGNPDGVSPAIARELGSKLGVPIKILPFDGPGLIADAAADNTFDIANIAAEPARAKVISFSPAYCEIQATFLVPPGSALQCLEDVDQAHHRIAVKERSAYDLWLTENLQHATLERAPSLDASFELFRDQQLDALAGLRPKLIEQQALMPGSILFETSFTSVQQSIGCKPGNPEATEFLYHFVEQAKHDGLIQKLIQQYGVQGRLSVAPPCNKLTS